MSKTKKLGFEDGVAENKLWSNETFLKTFQTAYNTIVSALRTLFNEKFGTLSFDDYCKPFDDSKIDINFKDPESGHTGTVCALKILDIPMIDFGNFQERSDGRVEDLSSFIARVNAMYLGKIVAIARKTLESLENCEDFRVFVQYGKTESEHFQLHLISNSTVSEEGVMCHYSDYQLSDMKFEDSNIELENISDMQSSSNWDRSDAYTYHTPESATIPIVESRLDDPDDDLFINGIQQLYTEAADVQMKAASENLKKRFFGDLQNFRPVTYDELKESSYIKTVILQERLKNTFFDKTALFEKDGNRYLIMETVEVAVWGDKQEIKLIHVSSLNPTDGVDKCAKFVILGIDDVYQYFDNRAKASKVIRYTVAKFVSLQSYEFWIKQGYRLTDIRHPERIDENDEGLMSAFKGELEIKISPRSEIPSAPSVNEFSRPEYVKVDINEVASRLGSVVHGLNRTNGTSFTYDAPKYSAKMASDEILLGVLHGLDADKSDPSYKVIEKSTKMIAAESGVIESIRMKCESGSIRGKGTIKFYGKLSAV